MKQDIDTKAADDTKSPTEMHGEIDAEKATFEDVDKDSGK